MDVWESWGAGPRVNSPNCQGEQCNQSMCTWGYFDGSHDFNDMMIGVLHGGRGLGMAYCTSMIGLPCLDGETLTEESLQIGNNGWGNCQDCWVWAESNLSEDVVKTFTANEYWCDDYEPGEVEICDVMFSWCVKDMCEAAGFDVSDMEAEGYPYFYETGMLDGAQPYICGEASTFDNSPTCHDPAACNFDEGSVDGLPCAACCEYPPNNPMVWNMYADFRGCNSCGDNANEEPDGLGAYPCQDYEDGYIDSGGLDNYSFTTTEYWCDTPECPANITDEWGNVTRRLSCAGTNITQDIKYLKVFDICNNSASGNSCKFNNTQRYGNTGIYEKWYLGKMEVNVSTGGGKPKKKYLYFQIH